METAVPPARALQALDGRLLQIRYRHPTTGWCLGVADLVDGLITERATVVGSLGDLPLGDPVTFYGHWDTHPQYGRQFRVRAARPRDPDSASGLLRYLATVRCPHLGAKTAAKLVAAFGAETLRALREDPGRVAAIKGVTPDRAAQWQQFFRERQGADAVIVWLLQWDIDPAVARRLYARYGAAAQDIVRANPYALTQDTWGVGFRTADRLALSMGWAPLSPERLEAVWRFGLQTALERGDCFQTTDQLTAQAIALLEDHDAGAAREALASLHPRLARLPDVVEEDGRWRLRWVDRMERQLARDLRAHPAHAGTPAPVDWAWLQARAGLTYAPAQQDALAGALGAAFSIITGGPGTGKTTILNGLLTWLADHEHVPPPRIVLAAPTARAAQRMEAVTGHAAQTIHRLLGWNPADRVFAKTRTDPVDADWLIVDEVSMLDLPLAHALWRATAPTTRVLWIGDAHQLPSVGPGSVLKDVMRSGLAPVFRLTENFRSTSGITVAAHELLAQRVPKANGDVAVARYEKGVDKTAVQQELLARIRTLHRQGVPWDAIQVLTPIRRGPLGTDALNPLLRDLMNPAPANAPVWTAQGGLAFRVGDRVMQTKNAYAKNVFNGDMGIVTAIRPDPAAEDDDDRLWVRFADQTVGWTPEEARDLRLAYATTVHKAQGSEFPVVVFPLFYDAYVMLYRNLVYTAMTRAREALWLFTEASALWLALKRGDGAERQTGLIDRLRERP